MRAVLQFIGVRFACHLKHVMAPLEMHNDFRDYHWSGEAHMLLVMQIYSQL